MSVAIKLPLGPDTVFAAFQAAATRYAQQPFICVLTETAAVYDMPAGELSYGEAQSKVEQLASAYRQAGFGHGHRVGVLLENRPDFFLHWFALNALGVSLVPINPDMRAAELEYLIDHSDVVAALAIPSRHGDIALMLQEALTREPYCNKRGGASCLQCDAGSCQIQLV